MYRGPWWDPQGRWSGQTAVVVGGGPSLKTFDLSWTRKHRVMAVNNAYQLTPWAEYLFFFDRRWLEWHRKGLLDFRGQLITAGSGEQYAQPLLRMQKTSEWSDEPWAVHGVDSGHMAVVAAAKLGAKRIVLAGFDMRAEGEELHWHPDHPVPSNEPNYRDRFAPQYEQLRLDLQRRGVQLCRCTPSALTTIPEITIEELRHAA